jgi:hypothetical protein
MRPEKKRKGEFSAPCLLAKLYNELLYKVSTVCYTGCRG